MKNKGLHTLNAKYNDFALNKEVENQIIGMVLEIQAGGEYH